MEAFDSFWRKNPALLYGLGALIGCFAALRPHFSLLVPVICFGVPIFFAFKTLRVRLFLAIATGCFFYGYANMSSHFPTLPSQGVKGTAYFDIESLKIVTNHMGKQWIYKGVIRAFDADPSFNHLPCSITVPIKEEMIRPPANGSYHIKGTLRQVAAEQFIFKPMHDQPWISISHTWSLAEFRYQAKKAVEDYIHGHILNPRNATFLTGIATGDFDDRLMTFEFGRFGLQHILAISGFHFGIIAGILSLLLRCFFSSRKTYLILILILSSYFIFLGCSASVMRAWITILIALWAFFLERRCLGMNSLGVALLLVLCWDPLMCCQIGFQFSFATTAAILMLYSCAEPLVLQLFPKRSLSQMVQMSFMEQHIYFMVALFRQTIVLAIAVNLVAMPISLFYFHKFPWFSLVYNLFFPFLVSFGMLLLILGILAGFFYPLLGQIIHHLNDAYTTFVLNFTYQAPASFDYTMRISSFPLELLVIYLSIIFMAGIMLRHYLERKNEEISDIAFV